MEARLVYFVDGVEVELERMNFEALDEMTYLTFKTEDDIIKCPRYKSRLGNLPENGELKIVYDGFNIPFASIEYFSIFGMDPLAEEKTMSVLVRSRGIGPSRRSLRENIVRTLSDIDVVADIGSVKIVFTNN